MNRRFTLRVPFSISVRIACVALLGCAAALAAVALTSGVGCQKAANGKLQIAVIPKGTSHQFWQSVKGGADEAGQKFNVDIIWKATMSESDFTGQEQLVQQFVADKVSGIVLAPQNDKALASPVADAKAAGIPVVIFDSALAAKPGTDFVSFVATNNEQAGELGGKTLAKLLNYKGKVVLLRYQRGSASTDEREDGFLKIIGQYKDINVISKNQEGGSSIESAKTRAQSMADDLQACDGIFCPNESSTLGMLGALEDLGLTSGPKKKTFVGFDASPSLVDAVKKHEIDALVAQDPHKMGFLAVKAMVDHLNNKPVDATIDIPASVITLENLNAPEIQQLLK